MVCPTAGGKLRDDRFKQIGSLGRCSDVQTTTWLCCRIVVCIGNDCIVTRGLAEPRRQNGKESGKTANKNILKVNNNYLGEPKNKFKPLDKRTH